MNIVTSSSARQQLKKMARMLKAISHPVRLEILKVLSEYEPQDVTTLCRMISIGCEMSMMSHHLTKMKDTGWLVSEKRGKQVFYALSHSAIHDKIIDCLQNINTKN